MNWSSLLGVSVRFRVYSEPQVSQTRKNISNRGTIDCRQLDHSCQFNIRPFESVHNLIKFNGEAECEQTLIML